MTERTRRDALRLAGALLTGGGLAGCLGGGTGSHSTTDTPDSSSTDTPTDVHTTTDGESKTVEREDGTGTTPTGPISPVDAEWRMAEADARRSGHDPNVRIDGDDLAVAWTADVGADHLVAADGTLYAAAGSSLAAVETGTGAVTWQRESAADGDLGFLGVVDSTCYCHAEGTVRAFSTVDGRERWRAEVGESLGLTAHDGTVYVTTTDDRVLALDAADGGERWTVQRDTGNVFRRPAVAEGAVYVAADAVYALAAADGTELWRERPRSHARGVTVVNGICYAGGFYGGVAALDAATGAHRWKRTGGPPSSRVLADGETVVVWGDGSEATLVAFDAASGEQLWRRRSYPHAFGGDHLVVSSGERIRGIHPRTGTEAWSYRPRRDPETIRAVGDRLYLAREGTLTAVR